MTERLATFYLLPDTLKVFWTSSTGQRKYLKYYFDEASYAIT